MPLSSMQGAPFLLPSLREKWGLSKARREKSVVEAMPPLTFFSAAQCAGTGSSVARPAGGTTTVDKLPSTVSF
jgi:hypothetical protein